MTAKPKIATAKPKRRTRAQPTTTRDTILSAAERVFAKHGMTGARIEKISKAAECYDSLIYYYFGSKEALFAEVLENAYRQMIEAEQRLQLDLDDPIAALKVMIQFPWRYYLDHPELITLLGAENMDQARRLKTSGGTNKYFSPAIGVLADILRSGVEKGLFRADLDTVDLYMTIMSLGYFYVSNRHTLSLFLGKNLMDEAEIEHWGGFITQLVLRAVCLPTATSPPVGKPDVPRPAAARPLV